jgi:molybdate transport system substrate-binding protein
MLRFFCCLVLPAFLLLQPAQAEDKPILVFAAASLKNALDEASALYSKDHSKVTVSYAASSALAKQIEAGAPADLFVSADMDWMDYLGQKSLIKPESVVKLLGNDIVLVAPADSSAQLPLVSALGSGKLAMADVKAVPAGKYGKASLTKLGLWDKVSGQVVQAENVRAALKLVAAKEATLGIVYASDAKSEPLVKVIDTFAADSHPKIVYPLALLKVSTHPEAQGFASFLQSKEAGAVFTKYGFSVLAP